MKKTNEEKCDFCKRPLTSRQWLNPFTEPTTYQCSRWWCRLLSGHWLWMKFQISVKKKYISIRKDGYYLAEPLLRIPYLTVKIHGKRQKLVNLIRVLNCKPEQY